MLRGEPSTAARPLTGGGWPAVAPVITIPHPGWHGKLNRQCMPNLFLRSEKYKTSLIEGLRPAAVLHLQHGVAEYHNGTTATALAHHVVVAQLSPITYTTRLRCNATTTTTTTTALNRSCRDMATEMQDTLLRWLDLLEPSNTRLAEIP